MCDRQHELHTPPQREFGTGHRSDVRRFPDTKAPPRGTLLPYKAYRRNPQRQPGQRLAHRSGARSGDTRYRSNHDSLGIECLRVIGVEGGEDREDTKAIDTVAPTS